MSNHTRFQYWQDQLEQNKLGVVGRLIEYEEQLNRLNAPVDGKYRRSVIQCLLENAGSHKSVLDGYDNCIIGISDVENEVVYSKAAILKELRTFCKTYLEALDYFEFNVASTAASQGIIIVDDTIF